MRYRLRAFHTLASTTDVEITSGTSFSVTLGAIDQAAVERLLNKCGTASTDGTTYNLAAAEDWAAGADTAGLNYWQEQMQNGASRGQILLNFAESAEYRAKIDTSVDGTLDYVGLLGRTPDASGFAYWLGQQESGMTQIEIIGQFVASPEFDYRFLPSVTS